MTAPYAPTAPELPERSRLRAGALTFTALTVVGLVGVFVLGERKGTPLRVTDLHSFPGVPSRFPSAPTWPAVSSPP